MSTETPEQTPPEDLINPEIPKKEQTPRSSQFDLINPESPEFIELRQKLIEQSGCPDIETDPEKFAEWLEKAHALSEYLGYLSTIEKIDPYGLLQSKEGKIKDLAILAKDFDREKKYSPNEIIELAFAYIRKQANTKNPKLKLNPARTYDEVETKNLYNAFNPRQRNFWYGHHLENATDLYLQIDQPQIQALIDLLKQWLGEARVEDEAHGSRIKGSESLQLRLLNPQATEEDFAEHTKKYGAVFMPTVEIRPLAYGIRHDEIPAKPYTEPPVSGLYREPAVLKESDLALARCDQQILSLLATLNQNKVPIVITFRSGNITITNLEIKE
ncbi:MAG: hypothetical protein WCT37_02340 [Patescibacteria group bacterium]|jgi:hypothetical protein